MSTPILPFAVWESGTNQNSVPANDNSLRNQILNGLVISDSTNAQPALVSPADDGAIYIMTGAATGLQWATFDEFDLAIFMGGNWYAFAPVEGIRINLAGALYAWDGAAYAPISGGSGGSASVGVQYVADTGSTADSDPGPGLLKWNNATQASATVLFLDDDTSDGVSLTSWWAALDAGGFCYLQHATDQDTWQIWEIGTITDATGYVKLAVTLLANGGSFADGDPMLVTLEQGATSGAAAWGTITGTLSSQTDLQAALDAKAAVGIPQNSQSSAYTLVISDANKHIYHPSADTTARIWTIPANSSVAFPIGTAVTFVNDTSAGVITIAITTDTLVLAGAGTTGSRTLAANGVATAMKIASTRWQINGTGLT